MIVSTFKFYVSLSFHGRQGSKIAFSFIVNKLITNQGVTPLQTTITNHYHYHYPIRDAQNGFNNSRKDLWLWYAGPWNKNKLFSYSGRGLNEIKEELYFWIHNIYRFEKRLPPITNPLWLKNDSGDIVRLHATLCVLTDSEGKGIVNVKILASSPSKSLLDDSDFSERFDFNFNFDCVKFMILSKSFFYGRIDWEILSPMAELDEDYKNWNTKFFKPEGF